MGFLRNVSFLLMGNKHFTKKGYERAAAKFDNSVMERSLKGKTCVVTGANSGLGFSTSQELARRGCTLYMVCRSEARGKDAVEQVKKDSGNTDVHLKVCDVSSLTSIAAFADDFKQTGAGLHVLINNAGAMFEERQRSSEGFDMSFATNTLGQLALTVQLLPALAASAPSRVLMVSSGGMYTETLDVSDFENKQLNPWDGTRAYAKDKRRQVALAEHLAQLWHPQGVDVYSMHPGWADTEGVRTSMPGFHKAFKNTLRDAKEGSDTIVWLALQDQDKLQPGAFYLDRAPQPKHLSLAGTQHTPQQAAELYDKLLRLAGTATAS